MDLPPSAVPVIAGGFLGAVTGFVMHRSSYCFAGAFRDLFLFRSTRLLESLLLLVASTAVLVEGARRAGLLPLYPFPLLAASSVASLAGGVLFGTGMVLAGGCVTGTLYQAGAGRVSAWIALAGMVIGSGLYAEVFPWCRAFDRATVLFGGARTLPELLGLDPAWVVVPATAASALALGRWHHRGSGLPRLPMAGYIAPWKASLVLALVTASSLVTVGMPLGVTTSFAKAAAALESAVAPGHVASLEYYRALPLDSIHPWTGAHLVGGPGPRLDGIAIVQLPIVAGILLGAALSALLLGELRARLRLPPAQAASALVGGLLMALGSRLASGCNLWHLMGGLSVMALGSLLFTAGMFAGAWAGSLLLVRLVLRQGTPAEAMATGAA